MQTRKGEESLRAAVQQLDKKLWHQLEEVWRRAQEGIQDAQHSKDGHQQGTPHCLAVEENLAALIPDDEKGGRFKAIDLFSLSVAAALHDTGKAGSSPDDHGHVSMWEVRGRAQDFGLDQGQAEVVGWIVRAHNDGNLEALPDKPVPLGPLQVSVRPLAALFKLADALHTDYRRVSPQVIGLEDRRTEDSPKTRFRLLVRGWIFADEDQVQLYAVPKAWTDEEVIYTGFRMTCQELEPVIPTLRDAGLPWKLILHLDDADLERKAVQHAEEQRQIERAFPGMDNFAEADAHLFKGRDDDVLALRQQVLAEPLTLLIGESGVGKTSLIRAGLFPALRRAGWRTVYTRPLDDPNRLIVRDLWHALLTGEPPESVSIVETLAQVCRTLGDCRLLVVLDQFEDVVSLPPPGMLDGLQSGLIAAQAKRFHNLRLLVSYRADAEATLGPLFLDVSGSIRSLPRVYLNPLSRDGARAALEAGFAQAQVGIHGSLLDTIVTELDLQTVIAGVYPPYLQMIGETLCRTAREENEAILTEELYRAKDGCVGIIGHYLIQRLAEFGERRDAARHVLVALVRSTGSRGPRSSDELQAETRIAQEQLTVLLAEMVDKRMVRRLGNGLYEVIHDYLAQLVDHEIVDEERRVKGLRELLGLKARTYTTYNIALTPAEMAQLYAVRQQITPAEDEQRLLLHSCLMEHGPAWFWFQKLPKIAFRPLLRDALNRPVALLRKNAAALVFEIMREGMTRNRVQTIRWEVLSDLRELLHDEDDTVRRTVTEGLAQVVSRAALPELRELLKDTDANVRRAATKRLIEMANREVLSDLRKLLKDEDADVRQAAVGGLVKAAGQEALSELHDLLQDVDAGVRGTAIEGLGQIAGRGAIPDLRRLLQDEDYYVRLAAIKGLVQVANREALPDLRKLLQDKDAGVRQAAAERLIQITEREDMPTLYKLLKDKDAAVRRAAAWRLIKMVGREGLPYLYRLLKDADADIRQVAAWELVQAAGQEGLAELRELLHHKDAVVRQAAVQRMTEIAGREAIPDLRKLLQDEDKDMRLAAANSLIGVAGREALPDLRELLKDEDGNVQQVAAEGLLQMASQEALPDLRKLLQDKDANVRRAVARVLIEVAGREVVPDLRDLLKDSDADVRWTAAWGLIQVAGREALPGLRKLLKDKDANIRRGAAWGLVRMAGREELTDLRELLRNEDDVGVQWNAAKKLVELASRDCLSDLRELLRHEDANVRQAAAEKRAEVAGRGVMSDLRELLQDEDANVRRTAAEGLVQVVGRRALPDLRELLQDADANVRWTATKGMIELTGREALPALCDLLQDEDAETQRAAENELERLISEDDIPWLTNLAAQYPPQKIGATAMRFLIELDYHLHSPFQLEVIDFWNRAPWRISRRRRQ